MKILITGSAGFIGFHIAKKLSINHDVTGVDNLNSYYDKNLKIDRNNILKKYITFKKVDLTNIESIRRLFKKNKFDIILHFAAQAGVRYSFENPESYIKNNIIGTYNLLEVVKDFKIKHLLLASTSSVYGSSKLRKSFKESDNTSTPVSLYASSKKSCEIIAFNYSLNFNIPISTLRLFTVYGPWGRPDMAIFKFTKSIIENTPIDIYNNGNLYRDFTYIEDLVSCVTKIIKIPPLLKKGTAPHRTINVGNQKPVNLLNFISILEEVIGKKAIRNYLPMQDGDVLYTHANTSFLKKIINFSPNTKIEKGIVNFYEWYRSYY